MSTLYQVLVSPSRITQAFSAILQTWQATDRLLLIGSSVLLTHTIVHDYPQFLGKIMVLEGTLDNVELTGLSDSLKDANIPLLYTEQWVILSQQCQVITLDFS